VGLKGAAFSTKYGAASTAGDRREPRSAACAARVENAGAFESFLFPTPAETENNSKAPFQSHPMCYTRVAIRTPL
jgi:hypothetical protein